MYIYNQVMLDSASGNSATYTSGPFLVGDLDQLSVSVTTAAAAASRVTLQGSNETGSINTWSLITGINMVSPAASPGLYSITPGFRSMRALRSSLDSQLIVQFNGKSNR